MLHTAPFYPRVMLAKQPERRAQTLRLQPQSQYHERDVSSHAQGGQHSDDIAARSELLAFNTILRDFLEELLVALLTSKQAGEEHACTVYCEQGTNGVELGREDLQHNQCEGELAKRCANVGTLEGPLCGPDLHKLIRGEHD